MANPKAHLDGDSNELKTNKDNTIVINSFIQAKTVQNMYINKI